MTQLSEDARDVPGWFGKLSSLGDFAHRRLPPAWLQACDAWLSGALLAGREAMGERWLSVYLNAPLLRFAWAPGVVDRQWWFGLLMPSCDSVGRYFPLVIAHPRPRPPEDRIALDHLELWYERLAQAAMGTLHDGVGSMDALEAALQQTPPWPTPVGAGALASPAEAVGSTLRLTRGAPLSQWLPAMAARDLSTRLAGCTLWWRTTEDGSDDCVDILQGLPDGARFAGLLHGDAQA